MTSSKDLLEGIIAVVGLITLIIGWFVIVYLGIRDDSYIEPGFIIIDAGFVILLIGVYFDKIIRTVRVFVQGI